MATPKTKKLKEFRAKLEPLMKPVEKVNLVDLIPGIITNPQQECAIVIQDGKEKKIINVCSKQYNLLPNKDIIEPLLETFGDENINLVVGSRLDARFSLDIIFKDHSTKIQGVDPVYAKLKVHNSYDGRAKYQFHMGFFRIICENGMVIPVEGYGDKNISRKMRHTPGLGETFDRDKISEMVNIFSGDMLGFTKPFDDLAAKKISQNDLPELLTEVVSKTKFPTRQLENVIDRLEIEMTELKQKNPNHWLVYNAFNYELNHSEYINMDPSKKEDLDHSIFNLLLKY